MKWLGLYLTFYHRKIIEVELLHISLNAQHLYSRQCLLIVHLFYILHSTIARLSSHEDEDYEELDAILHSDKKVRIVVNDSVIVALFFLYVYHLCVHVCV